MWQVSETYIYNSTSGNSPIPGEELGEEREAMTGVGKRCDLCEDDCVDVYCRQCNYWFCADVSAFSRALTYSNMRRGQVEKRGA